MWHPDRNLVLNPNWNLNLFPHWDVNLFPDWLGYLFLKKKYNFYWLFYINQISIAVFSNYASIVLNFLPSSSLQLFLLSMLELPFQSTLVSWWSNWTKKFVSKVTAATFAFKLPSTLEFSRLKWLALRPSPKQAPRCVCAQFSRLPEEQRKRNCYELIRKLRRTN